MSRSIEWDDLQPTDRPMCFRFGAGAFPCGDPYKVRITRASAGPRSDIVRVTRRVVCKAHYDQANGNAEQGTTVKARAKNEAMVRLAAAHRAEFQLLFEAALRDQGFNVDGTRIEAAEIP